MSDEYALLQRVGLLFRSVNVSFREAVDQALRECGAELSFAQASTLSILGANPGINGAQLARHSMVSPQAMTSVLRVLAGQGLAVRAPHPESQRADSWRLTDAGEQALGRVRQAFASVTARMLAGLDAADIGNLERSLRHCASALGE